jgi:hypothetical protein
MVESKREHCVLNLLVEHVGHEGVADASTHLEEIVHLLGGRSCT